MNDTYAHQVVKIYAKVFCDKPHDFEWVSQVQVGDCIDILKLATYAGKASWSRGRVLAITETKLQIEYLYDYYNTTISVNKDSMDIAPLGTRSKIFEWRMALKAGDVIDCEDNFSGWYNATIVSIKNIDEQKPEITLREEEIFDDEDKSGTVNLD